MLQYLQYIYRKKRLYQRGYSEDLNRQSGDGYTPIMVIMDKVLLQLLKVLKR